MAAWQACVAGTGPPLAARVECDPRRVLSAKARTAALGEGRVRELQEAVAPTLCRHLVVQEAPHGAGKGHRHS